MRLYLSGPMTGKPDNNRGLFNTAQAHMEALGHEVISPVELDTGLGVDLSRDATAEEYEEYLKRDLGLIPNLDAIVFLPGWEHSGGVGREGRVAIGNGLKLYNWSPEMPRALSPLQHDVFLRFSTTERVKVGV